MAAAGILKLQRAGFSEQQVEALAEYFDDQMATKADLASGVAEVRAELAAAEAKLETKIEQARSDTIKWVVGVAFAQAALILAVLRFLPGGYS